MFFKFTLASLILCAFYLGEVHAHGTITAVTGANGVNGAGFGIIASTPRDGSTPNPFEQDTSVIRDNEIASGKTGACGRTKAGGNNDVASQLAAASTAGLPSAAADGSVTMTLHQVNQDGAGPYTCDVSNDGGATFTDATVTQNVPGFKSLSLAKAEDFTLVAQMPAGMQCTSGPNGDACIMRCRNGALAGPFGSCVAVTNGGNATAAAAPAAASSAAAAAAAPAAVSPAAASPAAASPAAVSPVAAAPAAADSANDAKASGAGGILGKLGKKLGARDDDDALSSIEDALSGITGAVGGSSGAGGILSELGLRSTKKRYVTSRIAGKRAGLWIDA